MTRTFPRAARLRRGAAAREHGAGLGPERALPRQRHRPRHPRPCTSTSTVSESNVLRDLYDGLVTEDAAGDVIPAVAESWDVDEGGTVYTFHLRDDAKWSNGDPVTADDFVFAFRRIMDPATAAGYAVDPVRHPERRGDRRRRDAGRAARRRRPRPADPGHHPARADALLHRAAHPPDRLAAARGQRRAVRRRVHQARQPGHRTAPTCWRASRRTTGS